MEHLQFTVSGHTPLTSTTASSLAIPYLADEYDDSGDFASYPARQGWDVSTWSLVDDEDAGFDQNGKTIEEMSAFLQTWLYFGLLKTFMGPKLVLDQTKFKRRVGGRDFGDCSEQQWVLSTDMLVDCVGRREEQLKEMVEEERTATRDLFIEAWGTADATAGGLNFILFYGNSYEDVDTVVLEKCLLGVRLLLELLWRVSWDEKHLLTGELYYDLHLRRLLLGDGWCPLTVEFMQRAVPLQLQAYALVTGSVRSDQDHGQCTVGPDSKGCTQLQAVAGKIPRHVNSACECPDVHSPMDEVVSMLRDGMVPVLAIVTDASTGEIEILVDGLELENEAFQVTAPFTAFSHVWADGLGNPIGNYLPRCQILRLKEILDNLSKLDPPVLWASERSGTTAWKCGTIPLWLDTLCIPVSPEHQDLRDFSIGKMRDIYRKAAGVIVLDPDMMSLRAGATSLDVMIKALLSGWNSRLWTYQEAALTDLLYLAAEDTCFNLDDLDLRLAADDTCINPDDLDLRLSDELSGESVVYRQLAWTAWRLFRDFVHDSIGGYVSFTKPAKALQRMLRAASHRATSRSGDETVCLATFLRLDVDSLLCLPTADRMPALLTQLPAIPPEILFARGRHIEQTGFGWCPQSFLAPSGVQHHFEVDYPKTYIDEQGKQQDVPKPHIHSSRLGLSLFLNALTFHRPQPTSSDIFTVHTPDRGSYQCEVLDTGSFSNWRRGKDPTVDEESDPRSFVILLMDREQENCNLGIVVDLMAADEGRDIQLCHWVGIAEVIGSDQDKLMTPLQMVEYKGFFVPFREWVVD